MIYVLLGVAVGVLLPNQSAVNSRLRASVTTPWVMSIISFLVGTLCLLILTWATAGMVTFDADLFRAEPAWLWTGGMFGVVGMTTTVLLLPVLGALYSTALNLTAQVMTTMIIDHFGLFGVAVYPASGWRIGGGAIVVAAALLAVIAGRANPQLHRSAPSPGWYVAGLAIGMCFGFQVAINGQLTRVLGSALHSAFISFLVGTVILALLVAVTRSSLGITTPDGEYKNPWWMWTGGALGALYVTGVAYLSPMIGAAVTVIVIQVGLIAGSLAVDHFGLLSAPKKPVRPLQIVGLVFMVGGVLVINAPEVFV